jgi:hypothetical protein
LQVIRNTLARDGVRGLYAGCSALVVGNAAKAGVRFLSYDTFKSMLADNEVRVLVTVCWAAADAQKGRDASVRPAASLVRILSFFTG